MYIYCITNQINGKRYVGKTTNSVQERFQEHCRDSRKERCNKRPLYDAMNKYGIENFIVEELEQVEDETKLEEREIYWIQELQTYGKNGYNATKGGDGKILYDYKEVIELYNLGYTTSQVANKIGCDPSTVRKVLRANNIRLREGFHRIMQFDLAGNYIQTFESAKQAKLWLQERGVTNNKTAGTLINECCRGKRSKMYGYIWKYESIQK